MMAVAPKNIREIVEEGLVEAFKDAWQKELLNKVGWMGLRIVMPKRGRYQVWDGFRKVADHIKHRKEALAIMKLMGEEHGDS
jgi:hypothetical protein